MVTRWSQLVPCQPTSEDNLTERLTFSRPDVGYTRVYNTRFYRSAAAVRTLGETGVGFTIARVEGGISVPDQTVRRSFLRPLGTAL